MPSKIVKSFVNKTFNSRGVEIHVTRFSQIITSKYHHFPICIKTKISQELEGNNVTCSITLENMLIKYHIISDGLCTAKDNTKTQMVFVQLRKI